MIGVWFLGKDMVEDEGGVQTLSCRQRGSIEGAGL